MVAGGYFDGFCVKFIERLLLIGVTTVIIWNFISILPLTTSHLRLFNHLRTLLSW